MTVRFRRIAFGLLAVATTASCTSSASIRTAFDDEVGPRVDGSRILRRTYVMEETGETIPFAVYLPQGYTPEGEWPLAVGFMGSGLHYDFVMGFLGILDAADRHGYVLVTPLGYVRVANFGRTGLPEVDRRARQDVFNVLGIVRRDYNIDGERIYLFGHSAGSEAAYYSYLMEDPGDWAAVAMLAPPDNLTGRVQGDPNPEIAGKRLLVQIGSEDTDGQARDAVDAMRGLGLNVEYLEVPGGGHFLWMDSADNIEPLFRFFDGDQVGEGAL